MFNRQKLAHRASGGIVVLLGALFPVMGAAHPLGNFTVNHFVRLTVDRTRVEAKYVVDMAEIPAFEQLRAADANGDGSTSQAELNVYLARVADSYLSGLGLSLDGARETFAIRSQQIARLPGAGGLSTLRIEYDLTAAAPQTNGSPYRSLHFEDRNQSERIGWREIVVVPGKEITIFNSSAFENSVTDELRRYPADMLADPLQERTANLQFTNGPVYAGATMLRTRDGKPVTGSRDQFAELISVAQLTPGIALLGVMIAILFGAAHALSPGHGKTVVGAYLVGSRGTPRHALFLGLTVTITHTAGVFVLGLITLFASKYILPERLFPVLSLLSGGLVVFIGVSLFSRRLVGLLGGAGEQHVHEPGSTDEPHLHGTHAHTHSHRGRSHSHLPPGANGEALTWRSLLALGISGGLLPCPSALVVLLSAVALHRIGYGLVLVFSFSVGLAATLTGVGLAFVYAGRWFERWGSRPKMKSLHRVIPIFSAFAVSCAGLCISYEAIRQMGIDPVRLMIGMLADWQTVLSGHRPLSSLGGFAVLTFGLILGIKHATEADHVIAVSNIVSEHRLLTKAAFVGGLWGIGHTLTLVGGRLCRSYPRCHYSRTGLTISRIRYRHHDHYAKHYIAWSCPYPTQWSARSQPCPWRSYAFAFTFSSEAPGIPRASGWAFPCNPPNRNKATAGWCDARARGIRGTDAADPHTSTQRFTGAQLSDAIRHWLHLWHDDCFSCDWTAVFLGRSPTFQDDGGTSSRYRSGRGRFWTLVRLLDRFSRASSPVTFSGGLISDHASDNFGTGWGV